MEDRRKRILIILQNENEAISSSMLANRLGVSSRTIKNDIHIINKLTSNSIESSNKGYKLKFNLTKEHLNSILDTSSFIQSERLIMIVITILSKIGRASCRKSVWI